MNSTKTAQKEVKLTFKVPTIGHFLTGRTKQKTVKLPADAIAEYAKTSGLTDGEKVMIEAEDGIKDINQMFHDLTNFNVNSDSINALTDRMFEFQKLAASNQKLKLRGINFSNGFKIAKNKKTIL